MLVDNIKLRATKKLDFQFNSMQQMEQVNKQQKNIDSSSRKDL